jgi:hypothetical protein
MQTAILGIAVYPTNHVWANVDLLARSVAHSDPNAELVLVTAPLGDRDRALFSEFKVRAIECADPVPDFDRTSDDGRARQHAWICALFGARHSWYLAAIAELSATHVLIADTRDVVLTGRLTEKCTGHELVLSQETTRLTIGADPWNSQWVEGAYGAEGLREIGHKPILCAGVVFGTASSIRAYATAMSSEIHRLGFETVRRVGDQPIHNHLAYTGQLPPYAVSTAEGGWMRSVGLLPTRELTFDWLDDNSPAGGERTVVLHQYDRHVRSRAVRSALKRTVGLPWWKNLYSPFDAHPGVRLGRVASRVLQRAWGGTSS